MALIQKPGLQNEEEALRAKMEAASLGGIISGGATSSAGGAPLAGPQQASRAGVDVNSYLKANKAQTGDLADKLSGKITGDNAAIGADITKAENDTLGKIAAGKVDGNDDLVNRASTSPLSIITNKDDVANFTKIRDAQYTGPAALDGREELLGRIQTQKTEKDVPDSFAGSRETVKKLTPQSTRGMLDLDTLLLNGSPEAKAKVTDAQKGLHDWTAEFDTSDQKVGAAAADAKNSTEQARARLNAAMTTEVNSFKAREATEKGTATRKDLAARPAPATPASATDIQDLDRLRNIYADTHGQDYQNLDDAEAESLRRLGYDPGDQWAPVDPNSIDYAGARNELQAGLLDQDKATYRNAWNKNYSHDQWAGDDSKAPDEVRKALEVAKRNGFYDFVKTGNASTPALRQQQQLWNKFMGYAG